MIALQSIFHLSQPSVYILQPPNFVMDATALKFARKRFLVFKIIGFGPISLVNLKSVTKPIDVFCFLLPVIGGLSACYLTIVNRENFATSNSKIADYGNFVMLIASICVSMISVIVFFIFRHNFWSILLKMADIETKVRDRGLV
jgi:hypothetical protein